MKLKQESHIYCLDEKEERNLGSIYQNEQEISWKGVIRGQFYVYAFCLCIWIVWIGNVDSRVHTA